MTSVHFSKHMSSNFLSVTSSIKFPGFWMVYCDDPSTAEVQIIYNQYFAKLSMSSLCTTFYKKRSFTVKSRMEYKFMVINKMFRLITQAFSQVTGSYPTIKAYNLSGHRPLTRPRVSMMESLL